MLLTAAIIVAAVCVAVPVAYVIGDAIRTKVKEDKNKYLYFEAVRLKEGGIAVGRGLTDTEASVRVLGGGDIYTISEMKACNLATTTSGGFVGPEIHDWNIQNKWHVHLIDRVGGHIFYD